MTLKINTNHGNALAEFYSEKLDVNEDFLTVLLLEGRK